MGSRRFPVGSYSVVAYYPGDQTLLLRARALQCLPNNKTRSKHQRILYSYCARKWKCDDMYGVCRQVRPALSYSVARPTD